MVHQNNEAVKKKTHKEGKNDSTFITHYVKFLARGHTCNRGVSLN
jgi:hypothetical protein